MARAYGVLRLGLLAARHTVYIDPDGRIAHVDRRVKARTAGADLVARLEELAVPRTKGK